MRHGDKVNNLGRTESHRRALLANLAISLIEHKRITTTLAKAKALRRYVEPLITKAKDNNTHSRRVVFSYLQNKDAVKELFGAVAEKVAERPGGYVRIIKLGFRRGDGAETALIELVDFNETYNPNAGKVKSPSRKTRRGGAKKSISAAGTEVENAIAAPVQEEAAIAEPIEAVVEEAQDVVETVEAAAEETVQEVKEEVAEAVDTVADAASADDNATEASGEDKKEDESAA